jgi:IS1 family transposase
VIIACGLYLLSEEEKREKRKYWIHNVFRARGGEKEFHTLFRRLKDDRQKFFKCFKMSISTFKNLKELLPTDNQKT